jgi:hypothetical protein
MLTDKEIKEGNKLIADFMGLEFNITDSFNSENYRLPDVYRERFNCSHFDNLHFNYSWDWLMPVIEKICRTRIGDGIKYIDFAYPRTFGMINDKTEKLMVRLNGFVVFEAETLIEATYLAVIDYIKNK